MKKAVLVAAGLLAVGLFAATAASAAPLGGLAKDTITTGSSMLELVHDGNTHRSCQAGGGDRWHAHNRRGGRVACRPSRPGLQFWTWRREGGRDGWWHSRERRWH